MSANEAEVLPNSHHPWTYGRIGEAALVRPARRLEEQPQEVLRIGVARQPPRDAHVGRVQATAGVHRLLVLHDHDRTETRAPNTSRQLAVTESRIASHILIPGVVDSPYNPSRARS